VSVPEVARRDCGLTQAELARRAGISPQYVGLIEAGLRPSLRVKGAIAAVLGTVTEELWPEHDERRAATPGAVEDRRGDRRHGAR
jgi:putative molybdopterin biosynthesis protein